MSIQPTDEISAALADVQSALKGNPDHIAFALRIRVHANSSVPDPGTCVALLNAAEALERMAYRTMGVQACGTCGGGPTTWKCDCYMTANAQAAAARAQDAETDDYLLHALANAVEAIPVPREGFKAGWRDEEIWEWALRTAARAIRSTTRDGVAERDYAALQARIHDPVSGWKELCSQLQARNDALAARVAEVEAERDAHDKLAREAFDKVVRLAEVERKAGELDRVCRVVSYEMRIFTRSAREGGDRTNRPAVIDEWREAIDAAINAHAQGQAGEEKDG